MNERTSINEAGLKQPETGENWSTVGRRGHTSRVQRPSADIGTVIGLPKVAVDDSGQAEEMNADISERLNRPVARSRNTGPTSSMWPALPPGMKNGGIREYLKGSGESFPEGSWRSVREVPISGEILPYHLPSEPPAPVGNSERQLSSTGQTQDVGPGSEFVPSLVNKIDGPWDSKEEYLGNHYALLREDAVRPLREAVARLRENPMESEDFFGGDIGIYENVHITALTFGTRGITIRVTFSLARAGKRIHWEQSKRLISGSMIAMAPANDMFYSQCKVAVVAARPLEGLQLDPPTVDLYFANAEEIELDPEREWVILEARGAFFEAHRHTLLALQKLMSEPFPLSEHLVALQQQVEAPLYLQQQPFTDLSSAFPATGFDGRSFENVDLLTDWPRKPPSELDQTQISALCRMLTKRLAIVQGPPGTGKTHVSVVALRILLNNMRKGDAPIIVACQTNHALDQLLRHVAAFEPNFIRLGSRSKDADVIKKRTLFRLREEFPPPNHVGSQRRKATKAMEDIKKAMMMLLTPLNAAESSKGPLDCKMLRGMNVLTNDQCESLERDIERWVSHDQSSSELTPMVHWLGSALVPAQRKTKPDDFGFVFEEVDLEFEQLKELEAENASKDDDDFDKLFGDVVNIADGFTGKKLLGGLRDYEIEKMLETQDLTKIKPRARGEVYRFLQRKVKEKILDHIKPYVKRYLDAALERKAGAWEADRWLLRQQDIKVVGVTTTGLSKYRALISTLKPKIVLIEEAAETLEAPVTTACFGSLEHLILVGDHKQLRPHCQVKEHEVGEDRAFNLNVSLFERLVNNDVEFSTLLRQRRMIPEIRRVLRPIYGERLEDHPFVMDVGNRPPIPGMGGINSYFFTHEWPEIRDDNMSSCNTREAEMIVGFFDYLVLNGVQKEKITVLTFYNGQRKLILRMLRSHPNLGGAIFKVVTVDSYQGEENEVVLLSLVRSNNMHRIGFLNVGNRVCVALSRAQRGFYVFGNGELLCGENKLWVGVIEIMAGKTREKPATGPKRRLGFALPLQCSGHGRKVWIQESSDWEHINGGCERRCNGKLDCGHPCPLKCHPFTHSQIACYESCQRTLSCGHPCVAECCEPCRCRFCKKKRGLSGLLGSHPDFPDPEFSTRNPFFEPTVWDEFARNAAKVDEDKRREARDLASEERRRNFLDKNTSRDLSGTGQSQALEQKAKMEEAGEQDNEQDEAEDLLDLSDGSTVKASDESLATRKLWKENYQREGKQMAEFVHETSLLDM